MPRVFQRQTREERRASEAAVLAAISNEESRQIIQALDSKRQQEADLRALLTALRQEGVDTNSGNRQLDSRILPTYCPPFSLDDTTPEGLAKIDEAERFIRDYVSGDSVRRKPHLDRIFEEVEPGMGYPSDNVYADATRSLLSPERFAYDGKFCYLQNLMSDNPEYTAERFNTPQKREKLSAAMSYGAAYLALLSVITAANSTNLSGDILDPRSMQSGRELIPEATAACAVAARFYANKIAILNGSTPPYSTIDFHFQADPSGRVRNDEIFSLKERLREGTFNTESPGVRAAIAHFNLKMNAIFDTPQQSRLQAAGFSMFDMIYINGVSATEAYREKYQAMPQEDRDKLIKAEIISSMVNDRAKIDVTPILVGPDGRQRVTPISLKPSVKEIQPELSAWKRAVNRFAQAFNRNLKPFKTEDERLAAAHGRPEPESEARLTAAIESAQVKVTKADEDNTVKEHLERMRREPASPSNPFLKLSTEFEAKLRHERTELCKALFGDDVAHTAQLPQAQHIRVRRSGVNIGVAMLFADGYSFEDIFDPNKLKDEKRKAGMKIGAWVRQSNDTDAGREESKRAIADVYQRFAERYSTLPNLQIDHTDLGQLAASYRELECRGPIAFDIGQELSLVKDIIGKAAYDHLGDVLAFNSVPYVSLKNSIECPSKALCSTDERRGMQAAQDAIRALHTRQEIGETLNQNRNGLVKDIPGMAIYERESNIIVGMSRTGAFDSASGNLNKTILNLCCNRDILVESAEQRFTVDYRIGVDVFNPQEMDRGEPLSIHNFEPEPIVRSVQSVHREIELQREM